MTFYLTGQAVQMTEKVLMGVIQHSRTKHIVIRHHFSRDLVEKKVVTLEHMTN
jgi:hypothetical protein